MKKSNDAGIPSQELGNEVTVEYSIVASSRAAARSIYKDAVIRLFNVNEWHLLTGSALSIFQLTDQAGNSIDRSCVMVNDYLRINIPAFGSTAGDGDDWVKVEMIDSQQDIAGLEHSTTMRVRPTPNPLHPQTGTAHFFDERATSTFRVAQKGLCITAAVYGRNEISNTDSPSVIDNVRNAVIAIGAQLGGSRIQWKSLAKGIIDGSN